MDTKDDFDADGEIIADADDFRAVEEEHPRLKNDAELDGNVQSGVVHLFRVPTPAEPGVFLDEEGTEIVARGREAWASLKRHETWAGWLAVGRALAAGRAALLQKLGLREPTGRVWSRAFGGWLEETGFAEIDAATRSKLMQCLEDEVEIEAWRRTLGLTRMLRLNHPSAVLARWQKATQIPAVLRPAAPPRKRSQLADLHAQIEALSEARDHAERRAERAEEDVKWRATEIVVRREIASDPSAASELVTEIEERYGEVALDMLLEACRERQSLRRQSMH
jgi:hypothetical protein